MALRAASTRLLRLAANGAPAGRTLSSAPAAHPAWRLGRLNHVAIATPDLDKSVALYRDVMGATVRCGTAQGEDDTA